MPPLDSKQEGFPYAGVSVSTTKDDTFGILNQPIDTVQFRLTANDIPHRAKEVDGEQLLLTMDHVPGRINYTIENGYVTKYDIEV